MMVKIYGMQGCKQCKEAISFCEDKGIKYVYIDDQEKLLELAKLAGIRTAPVIEAILSFDELSMF